MACNILNGASRPCKKINALLHRKECIYSVQLTCCDTNDTNNNNNDDEEKKEEIDKSTQSKGGQNKLYRLALGTNLGRLLIVTLKQDLSWTNTRRSFITEYTIASENDPVSKNDNNNKNSNSNKNGYSMNDNNGTNNDIMSGASLYGATFNSSNNGISSSINGPTKKKSKHHRKASSKSFSVLTAREKCFREMSDPITVMITYESMKKYLWNESSQIEEQDIKEFFQFLQPNKKNQITFTQFVKRVDEDGNFMRAFEQFCLTGSSRTDRRAWMDDDNKSDEEDDNTTNKGKNKGKNTNIDDDEDEDSEWELAMLNNRGGDKLKDEFAITAIAWNSNDNWIITGHQEGTIKFWSKEYYPDTFSVKQNKYLKQSEFYYVCRGSMKRHFESISSLSLSGTYLVSSSNDGNILIWHLDFLLPSVNLPMNITLKTSKGIIQLLATINSAHLGDEICDVGLSSISTNLSVCIPNALYLLSCGADENIRCRDVMEILRQQLTLRILAESQPQVHTTTQQQQHDQHSTTATTYNNDNNINNNNDGGAITTQSMQEKRASMNNYRRYDSYTANRIINRIGVDNQDESESDGSDFGATTYN